MPRAHYVVAAVVLWKVLRKTAPRFARGLLRNSQSALVGDADPAQSAATGLLQDSPVQETPTEPPTELGLGASAENAEAVLKEELLATEMDLKAAKKELTEARAALTAEKQQLRETESARIDAEVRRQVVEADAQFLRDSLTERSSTLESTINQQLAKNYELGRLTHRLTDKAKLCMFEALQQREAASTAEADVNRLQAERAEVTKELEKLRATLARASDNLDVIREEYVEEARKLGSLRMRMTDLGWEYFRLMQTRDHAIGVCGMLASCDARARAALDTNQIIKDKTSEIKELQRKVENYERAVKELVIAEGDSSKQLMGSDGREIKEDAPRDRIHTEGTAALCLREAKELLCDLGRSNAYHRTFVDLFVGSIGDTVKAWTEQVYVAFPFVKDLEEKIFFLRDAYGTEEAKGNGLREEMQIRDERAARIEEMLRELAENEKPAEAPEVNAGMVDTPFEDCPKNVWAILDLEAPSWNGMEWAFDVPWDSSGRLPGHKKIDEESSDSRGDGLYLRHGDFCWNRRHASELGNVSWP